MRTYIFLLSLVMAIMPSIASANLLVNPGFEEAVVPGSGNFPAAGWNATNSAFTRTEDNPHSGSYNLRNSGAYGTAYQFVNITPGVAYRLTGYCFLPSGSSANSSSPDSTTWWPYIGIDWYDAQGSAQTVGHWGYNFANSPRNQYNFADSGYIIAPEGAINARISVGTGILSGSVETVDFDDINFSPIPEPMSMTLFGSGLIALLGLIKTKKF